MADETGSIKTHEWPSLVEALVLWTGWGKSAWPLRDDAKLIERFGIESAPILRERLALLEKDFYGCEAWRVGRSLAEAGRFAAEEFRRKHPRAPEEIARVFEWSYTYDHK